jgi:hypothetical protein
MDILGSSHPGDTIGYVQTVRVANDYGKNVQRPNSYVISSTEMDSGFSSPPGRRSSEVLFLVNGPGPVTSQIDPDIVRKGGNLRLENQPDGIYATPDGLYADSKGSSKVAVI